MNPIEHMRFLRKHMPRPSKAPEPRDQLPEYVFVEALDMPDEPVTLTDEQERQLARLILICFKQWIRQ